MSKYWDPSDYTIEDQLREMVNGRDVATSGNDVLKEDASGDVSIYWPSDSDRGHGHAVIHGDDSYDIIHY